MNVSIRRAAVQDLAPMLEIYNDVILTTTAIYTEIPVTLDVFRERFLARQSLGYPTFVAESGGQVAGFASYGEFRAWPCYRHTVEHSVHVERVHRGQGIGRKLLMGICEEAMNTKKHVVIAGIDADNAASLHVHSQLGFEQSGHLKQVGRKFGRWLDLIFVQKNLFAP